MPSSNNSTTPESYNQCVLWCWVLITAFALFRLPGLGVPLASDELASVSLWAQMPTLKIFSNYQYPNNHIFLTVILSFLLKNFGLQEWLLRIPLLICGLTSLYLSFQLGKKISGQTAVGISTSFLMAISERHIFYSTNARGYIVIMVLALMAVVFALDRLEGQPLKLLKLPNGFNVALAFIGWVSIWVLGTWTIPTFLFFEVSFVLFLVGILISGDRHPAIKKMYLVVPLVSSVMGGIGFYFQYYVLISPAMLAEATSTVATISYAKFFPGLLVEWTSPFEVAGILFLLFALLGLAKLFQQNPIKGFLLACVCLGPIFLAIAGFLLGKLPTLPYSRTFFYLQPFFLMLSVMGARQIGAGLLNLIRKGSGSQEKDWRTITTVLAAGLFLISGVKFIQQIYPQRMSREPLNKVHAFVKNLNSNDLFLVSHDLHVEFFLYGAREMRNRIEHILREEKLGDIYFLEYKKIIASGTQRPDKKGDRFLSFPALTGNAGKEGPLLPEKALEISEQFGSLVIYKLKKDWVQPLAGWEKAGKYLAPLRTRWEKFSGPSGTRTLIRFEDSFTVALENKEPLFQNASGLTLNLMEVAGNDKDFSTYFLGGRMKEGSITLDPGWLPNAWILDHPYGSDIYNHRWNPAIFISQGAGRLSVLNAKIFRLSGHGALRSFLSYRIEEPGVEGK